jgi:hypothetical protein
MVVEEENGRFLTRVPGHNLARSTHADDSGQLLLQPRAGAVAGACAACR